MDRAERVKLARQVAAAIDPRIVAHLKGFKEEKALAPAQRDPARIEREAWDHGYLSAVKDILGEVEKSDA